MTAPTKRRKRQASSCNESNFAEYVMGTNVLRRIALAGVVALGIFPEMPAAEQNYPSNPVRLIAASSPGSGVDIVGRIIAQKLGERLGQQVVVDNRAGAGGNLGAEIAAKPAPDGYTLFMGTPA